jgi:hypothetical protein
MPRLTALAAAAVLVLGGAPFLGAQGDLDALMQRVLSTRDENWKKLQQYILDERESIDLRGAAGAAVWSDVREYRWFTRDGYFVRSPLKANGVTVSDADRRAYEGDFVRGERERDERSRGRGNVAPTLQEAGPPDDLNGLIRQTREPRFVSSASFLRFRFDEGRYAFVGKEQLEGREVLRIEYYPSNLVPQNRRGPGRLGASPVDAEMRRLLNKVALVTLWVDPATNQILKYTFDNVALDFLPAQWLVRLDSVTASMAMAQAFPDVWLPRDVEVRARLALAIGDFDMQYQIAYHDYRRADANATFSVPEGR